VFISCAAGTACEEGANFGVDVMRDELGWEAELINADGTPEGFLTAFDSAMAMNPDVIFGIAVADEVVGSKLAEAREKGIVTIASAVENNNETDPYDGYVSGMTNAIFELMAYSLIDQVDEGAHMLLINDSSFPNLVTGQDRFAEVVGEAGIKTTDVEWTIADGLDPVRAASIVQAALRVNPDATHVVMPYSIGVTNVIDAVRTSGVDVLVVGKDTDAVALGVVANGDAILTAGPDFRWATWAQIDLSLRVMDGQEVPPADELGLGVHVFVESNVPEDNITDYTEFLDYQKKYLELWGLGGE
jgi:ABC-type sugar transport system substrate-binding protein